MHSSKRCPPLPDVVKACSLGALRTLRCYVLEQQNDYPQLGMYMEELVCCTTAYGRYPDLAWELINSVDGLDNILSRCLRDWNLDLKRFASLLECVTCIRTGDGTRIRQQF